MRRTKATLVYRKTKNLRAVQLLLGHTKLESTVRYLGIEVDDATGNIRTNRDLVLTQTGDATVIKRSHLQSRRLNREIKR